MPAISGRDMRRLCESLKAKHGKREGGRLAVLHLREALDAKHLKPSDFSIRKLFEAFVPDSCEWIDRTDKAAEPFERLLEGGDGAASVGYSDFSNITGQIFFTEVKDAYELEEFVFSRAIEAKGSDIQDVEKIPGITQIGDEAIAVDEGQEFPVVGVSEDYQDVPYKRKRGFRLNVTKEAVRGDRTGVLLERCGKGGEMMGINLEKRVIDAIIDQGPGALSAYQGGHRYTWKGTAYATYQSSAPWINVVTTNGLNDETNIDAAWQTMAKLLDPYTGEPILVQPDTLIVSLQNAWLASRIAGSSEFRRMAPGYETSGNPGQTLSAPALHKMIPNLKVMTSRFLYSRMNTASEAQTDWFLCNLKKGVRRYYNWDIQTRQRGSDTEEDFKADIVMQFRADAKDSVSVFEPRVMLKSTA